MPRLTLLGAVLLALLAGGLGGAWLFERLVVGFTLTNQPGTLLLPQELTVGARMTDRLAIGMKGRIKAQVPLQQTLEFPIRGAYDTEFDVDSDVHVKFEVIYEGTIPVDTIADIEAHADFNFQDVKKYRNVFFRAKLPMKFNLPVKLRAPVDQDVRITFKGPLKAALDYTLVTPVDTQIDAVLNVDQTITMPVISRFRMTMQLPQDPRKVIINHSDLRLRLNTLRFETAATPDVPRRTASPWGAEP